MSEYILATASTADLPDTYLDQHNVPWIAYPYRIETDTYYDDCRELTRAAAYDNMRRGVIYSTSMINADSYSEFFRSLLSQGKDVLYLDMSREMSSSYLAAQQAAEMMKEEFPDRRLHLLDTRCISGGLGVLVDACVKQRDRGLSFDELISYADNLKLHIMHRFTVDDLHYLKRGGRVSNASALIGSLLSIKPVLYVPDEGTLVAAQKVRGRRSALNALFAGIKRDMVDPDGQTVRINHADCLQDALWVKDQIISAFPSVGGVEISDLGVVIGAHCGPGLLAVFHLGDKRKP